MTYKEGVIIQLFFSELKSSLGIQLEEVHEKEHIHI